MKILIVEDNLDIHSLITELLETENYKLFHAYSGTEALLLLEKEEFHLVLLDLMLPGIDGEEIIKKIKDTPIIVLSAKTSITDKTNCLLNGANDYITKPFDNAELLARIKVQLRLRKNYNSSLEYKGLKLKDHCFIQKKEKKIKLTKTEYAILKQLILNSPHVIPKAELLDLISTDTLDGDENSLKVHISNIRKKLKKITNNEYIESVWGIGFKMHE